MTEKRNHHEDCYSGKNSCNSMFVLLRKLLPHFDNVRQVYSQLNELRGMHEIVADLDAALFSGDISYLLRLCEYKPPEKPSQVFDVIRPNEEVNRDALLKKYGKLKAFHHIL